MDDAVGNLGYIHDQLVAERMIDDLPAEVSGVARDIIPDGISDLVREIDVRLLAIRQQCLGQRHQTIRTHHQYVGRKLERAAPTDGAPDVEHPDE